MNPTLEELGIDRLSVEARIDLIEQIWDSLPEADQSHSLPEWHIRELERRLADPRPGIPWEEVKARLMKRS